MRYHAAKSFSSWDMLREHFRCNTWGRLKVCAVLLGVYLHLCNEWEFWEDIDDEDIIDGLGEMHLFLEHDFIGVFINPFVRSWPFCILLFTEFLGCNTGLGGKSGVTGIWIDFDFIFVRSIVIGQFSDSLVFRSLQRFWYSGWPDRSLFLMLISVDVPTVELVSENNSFCCMTQSNSLARLWRKSSSGAERACVGVYRYTGKVRFHYRLLSVLYRSESGTLPQPIWGMWILKLYRFC